MKVSLLTLLSCFAGAAANTAGASAKRSPSPCQGNSPTARQQWCDYDIRTDYTAIALDTGVTREFWFDVDQLLVAPDGRPRWGIAINGSIPGPTIEADWGDTVVVHLRNLLPDSVENGTSMHFHGLRQYRTNPMDGVVSVTQCPIPSGSSMTYPWRAMQYGTTWYHSLIGLQTWEGVFGGIIIHGPASANYDEDKGVILFSDWDINTVDELWDSAQLSGSLTVDNALINGMNVFGADNRPDQTGHRFNTTFTTGKSYRLRLGNAACDTHFKFSIDHHTMTVIAADLVPIKPYRTTVLNIAIGQRYDVIVQADQAVVADRFWLRAVPQSACSMNLNADNIRGIIYYDDGASDNSLPKTTAHAFEDSGQDEDASLLAPIVSKDLDISAAEFFYNESLVVTAAKTANAFYRWYINGTSMHLNWSYPTLRQIQTTSQVLANTSTVISLPNPETWVVVAIETNLDVPHPIRLHAHDFLIIAQGSGTYQPPEYHGLARPAGSLPKRDTALLPESGYLVLAYRTDNPGAWLMHCHIGWHLEQGFALQFVEQEAAILEMLIDDDGVKQVIEENCAKSDQYWKGRVALEDGSGV
ncbi:hypothetical protein N7474_005657 [Penicillium riverlandense]|uniref:uncharacterized protein n=1 Tax=Penicillium riverlandense TaxID=1903569 RepID=UPI0025469C10|nr:uncharacterized protein N7474_005657 [Penicillium riverlandense]KAJ5820066.1 hypothetical protein N7474_005657 [Penicillium riverlandense]